MGDLRNAKSFILSCLVLPRSPSPCRSTHPSPRPTLLFSTRRRRPRIISSVHFPSNTPPYSVRSSHHLLRLRAPSFVPQNSQPLWINETGGSAPQITITNKNFNPMFRKYSLSRTLFPPLLSAPVATAVTLTPAPLELNVGCTGGIPWQALTLNDPQQLPSREQTKPASPSNQSPSE